MTRHSSLNNPVRTPLVMALALCGLVILSQPMQAQAQARSDVAALLPFAGSTPLMGVVEIADSGEVVGSSKLFNTAGTSDLGYRAVMWSNGVRTNLGALNTTNAGVGYGVTVDINSSGVVAGHSTLYNAAGTSSLGNRVVVWTNGVMSTLGTLGTNSSGFGAAFAKAINNSGVVVGYSSLYSGNNNLGNRAVVWSNGAMTNLGSLGTNASGVGSSLAVAINGSGVVAGYSALYNSIGTSLGDRAVVWSNGVMTNLGSLGTSTSGSGNSSAVAINSSGVVAGSSTLYNAAGDSFGQRAFVWRDGVMTNLGSLGAAKNGGGSSTAVAINNSGAVAGNSSLYNASGTFLGQRAFVWRDGVMTNLGVLGLSPTNTTTSSTSTTRALNDSGQVVGNSQNFASGVAQSGTRAFLYNAGQMYRLDSFAPTGWVWTDATSINKWGQVAGVGTFNNATRGFVFTPHPDWQGGSGNWSDASKWNYATMGAFGFTPGAPHKVKIATTAATTVTGPATASVTSLEVRSTVAQGATLNMNGGELSTVDGTVLGSGAVLTGSGRLVGSVQAQAGSLFKMALGGTTAGESHDKLVFDHAVTLGGDLEVLWLAGFAGSAGQVFDLFDWNGGVSGSFGNMVLPTLISSLQWDTSDLYNGGSLRVASVAAAAPVPEPETYALALAGLLVVGYLMYRRRA
jgi:probable HAF family extracellular repeat protein